MGWTAPRPAIHAPSRARLELPGIPMHIVQRGVNRAAVFLDDDDREHLLALLHSETRREHIAIHAYVLMGNHVHLLATAHATGSLSRAMRRHGQCYVQAFNRRHRRTGTLRGGRFKSCLVDSDRYLTTVDRYIELNPVRARIADVPEAYRWSSVHSSLGLKVDPIITPHPGFLALGPDAAARAHAYRTWLYVPLCAGEQETIREHLAQERALGEPRFQAMVEETLDRPARVRPPGRERRSRAALEA